MIKFFVCTLYLIQLVTYLLRPVWYVLNITACFQSAGTGKDTKKGKKSKVSSGKESSRVEKKVNALQIYKSAPVPKTGADGEDSDAGETVEKVTLAADVDMLDSLTGIPVPEDELLFAIPVVAPYNTLHNFK